jgi:hypothetical protein
LYGEFFGDYDDESVGLKKIEQANTYGLLNKDINKGR